MKLDVHFPHSARVTVLLDGVQQKYCTKLDTIEGWVELYRVENDRIVANETYRVHGEVTVKFNDQMAVELDYTNHRGERFKRKVVPIRLKFGVTPDHPGQEQWLLDAYCLFRGAQRTFAIKDIYSWTPVVL